MVGSPLVTLTTDFGSHSTYVAQLKGVLLSLIPEARLVDVSHEIQPQQIAEASWVVEQLLGYFPPETCHLVVVDPGVGTSRQIVMVRTAGQVLVGPDNGVFTRATDRFPVEWVRRVREQSQTPDGRPVAPTFHGRDRMVPVVAEWFRGLPADEWGDQIGADSLVKLPRERPRVDRGKVVGRVEWIDRFGNLVTNIERQDVADDRWTRVELFDRHARSVLVEARVTTYGECSVGEAVTLWGSTGYLEIAVVNGNAAAQLGVERGALVIVCGP